VIKDLFWFFSDGNDHAIWLVNQRLQVHLLGWGFQEGAD